MFNQSKKEELKDKVIDGVEAAKDKTTDLVDDAKDFANDAADQAKKAVNISADEVVIELADPSRAGVIIPVEQEENEDLLMLLMPMMLND